MDKDGSAIPATGIGMSQTTSTIAPNAAANVTAAGGVGGGGGAAITIGKLKSKTTSNNKKRPGLGDSIIPSKKVIKAYNALKKWTRKQNTTENKQTNKQNIYPIIVPYL